MKAIIKFITSSVLSFIITLSSQISFGQSNGVLTIESVVAKGPQYDIVDTQVGTWNVEQKVWNDKSQEPTATFIHVARRTYQGHFLEEVMEPKEGTTGEKFKRITFLNFNNATLVWEYIVLDTRYPLMMFESSNVSAIKDKKLELYLPAFVVPPAMVGDYGGQMGHQRREIIFDNADKTTIKQYWSLPGKKEFLAIQYTYTKIK